MKSGMHAHRCEACAARGKETVWIHSDDCVGVREAHKCPECGAFQWRKWMVEAGKLPQAANHHSDASETINTIIGYVLLFVGLALLGYGAYQYIKDRRTIMIKGETLG